MSIQHNMFLKIAYSSLLFKPVGAVYVSDWLHNARSRTTFVQSSVRTFLQAFSLAQKDPEVDQLDVDREISLYP